MANSTELGLEITELRLGLPGAGTGDTTKNPNNKIIKKRNFSEIYFNNNDNGINSTKSDTNSSCSITGGDGSGDGDHGEMKSCGGEIKKDVQVVGWPPVCSYRRKNSFNEKDRRVVAGASEKKLYYVKVSMDGAPFLRKVDLGLNKGYSDLAMVLEKLFHCVGISNICEALMRDTDKSEYIPIYEDKDGDWMLAGDVPWEMFIESCKRLRIMKRSEAKGFGLMQSRSTDGGGDGSDGFKE